MTFDEYLIRLEAFQLRTIKRNEELAYQAWLNQQVQATTGSSKNPKPKFRKFDQFFDTNKMIDEVRGNFEADYKSKYFSKSSKDTSLSINVSTSFMLGRGLLP